MDGFLLGAEIKHDLDDTKNSKEMEEIVFNS